MRRLSDWGGVKGRRRRQERQLQSGAQSGPSVRGALAPSPTLRPGARAGGRMRCWQLPLLLLLFFWALPPVPGGRHYPHSAMLDGSSRYRLLWAHQGNTIAFRLEVRTQGYVGFGFSPTGAMASADIVVGGLDRGKPYLQDCFTNADRVLKKDSQQDYHLEYAMENNTHTILAFSRQLHTCDPNDKSLTESTVRVIWAYHDKDFKNGGQNYHGSNRGTKSLRLLNPEKNAIIPPSLPYFDLANQNVAIPEQDTTYWCQMFKIPALSEKHHVIKVEPLIQKGHENVVHHILLYQCSSSLNDSVLDYGHECYHPNMPDSFLTCQTVIFAWAIGGEGFTYPPHVGLSIGTALDPQYVLMEVHYDNPSYVEGMIDNSGLRLFYTPDLRRYDAGVIEAGLWVSLFHNIPPGMPEFMSEGHCTLECLEEGDNLVTECHYSTLNRSDMTWGGFSTRNEMCLSYLLYYPKINLTRCESIPDLMEQLQFIGVKQIYRPVRTWPFIIKSPKQYKNLSFVDAMNKFKWSREQGHSYNDYVLKLPVNVRCTKTENAEWTIHGMMALPPEIERPHTAEPIICSSSSCLNANLFLTMLIVLHISAIAPRNQGPFVQL
ncbi:DBH-like monooxygenase protein 1 isoform 2-T2 [Liasis olivaceus]